MYRVYGAIGLLLLTASAVAQQQTLTEQMALQLGLAREPVQQRVEGRIAEAQSDVIAAQIRPNPELSFERETLNDAEDHVEHKLVVSQQFDFSGRRALHIEAADRHLDATRLESDAWRAELATDIRERYHAALLQQARRAVYAKTQQRIEVLGKALQKRRHEGDVSLYDYQRVITERAAVAQRIDRGEYRLVRRASRPHEGLVDWLLACPEKGYFTPIMSEPTDTL